MNSELSKLTQIVKPPTSPKKTSGDWNKVERILGISLPPDYKEFISEYGTGSLQSFMHIWNYLDIPEGKILDIIRKITSEYEYDKKAGYPIDFKPFPEAGGLIPFCSTDDGNYLNWRTTGAPSEWCVVAYDSGTGRLINADGVSMVRCLSRLVKKDNPFGNAFCNVENFVPPVVFHSK